MIRKFVFAILFVCTCVLLHGESRFEKRAAQKREVAAKIAWFSHEPIQFTLRRGNHPENYVEYYERQHEPANVQMMADAGVRYGRLRFYKGLGLQYEAENIRQSAEVADLMHKLGMKVSVYVAGTMFVETFYREVPEAIEWEQRDQLGRPVYYIETQTFRRFACFNEPKYREYMKKVLKEGLAQIKPDQVFFDNIFLLPEPKSCRCPRCIRAFKDFLKERYPTKEAAFRRFGYPDPEYIVVNDWDVFNSPDSLTSIDDPILQEWTRFRCETVARHCGDFYDYVKSLYPKASVGFNHKGIYGLNRMWRNAIYHPMHMGRIDFSPFDVGGMDARIDERTGALVSEIRSYKMARTLGYSNESSGDPLEFAQLMSFNPQKYVEGYGWQGSPNHTRGEERSFSPEAEFFREYSDRYFNETENVADVAVLRTWPSMAYSIVATQVPTILMEQVLIQHKVPFDIIFDEQMDKIGRYRAVILPGQESLSQAWVDKLVAYAQNGGTVVFTDNTAHYNDWREARQTNPLLDRMGTLSQTGVTVKTTGKGKMVYIREIVPGITGRVETRRIGVAGDETASSAASPTRGGSFPAENWVLPKNHVAIQKAIVDNLRDSVSVTTGAPLTTVMEILNRPKTGDTILHFVNFNTKTPGAPFQVRLRKQFPNRKAASVSFFKPEADDPVKLQFTEQGGWITFTAPASKVYSMVVVSQQ